MKFKKKAVKAIALASSTAILYNAFNGFPADNEVLLDLANFANRNGKNAGAGRSLSINLGDGQCKWQVNLVFPTVPSIIISRCCILVSCERSFYSLLIFSHSFFCNTPTQPPVYETPETIDFYKTMVVGFPSGDKRLTFIQMEALTGWAAKDEWDFEYLGMTNNPFIKANYPHHGKL